MNEFEYTIINTIQVTRIVKSSSGYTEKEVIDEQGKAITNTLINFGCDDAIVLDHKVFVRKVEYNNVDNTKDNVEEREE